MKGLINAACAIAAMTSVLMLCLSFLFCAFGENSNASKCLVLAIAFGAISMIDMKMFVRDATRR